MKKQKQKPSTNGLSTHKAKKLLARYGPNEIHSVGNVSPFFIFLRQIRGNFVVYLLLGAVILSFMVDKSITAYTVIAVILVIIVTGFIQEYRSEKAIKALKGMLLPISVVKRDGVEVEIPSSEIVSGDVLVLRTGEKIPADAVVIEEKELQVNESTLTGESKEVRKFAVKNINKAKAENQVFMGTYVFYGHCLAMVVHTGMNTKFGEISRSISESVKELPLQKKINRIALYMVIVAVVISVATGALMLFRTSVFSQEHIYNIIILVIALSISAFPEGFPVVLISTLSVGAHRMAKKNAIVNRMSIIETLGETTVICCDKTGTLTRGEMTVSKIWSEEGLISVSGAGFEAEGEFSIKDKIIKPLENPVISRLLTASVLCNDAAIKRTGEKSVYHPIGSVTEAALLVMAAKAGIFKDDLMAERAEEIPFNSERKKMSVLCRTPEGNFVYTKGALEMMIDKCSFIETSQGRKHLNQKSRERIEKIQESLAKKSMRTLAVAYKPIKKFNKDDFEEDLIFLGLLGMDDPPREEVKEAIDNCRQAGIGVKLITGDYQETAIAVARQIGLSGKTMLGRQIEQATDEELENIISEKVIFARVKPEHKLRLVQALKTNGEIVTMTGDGVNDAPALKEAHIGVAMGKNGTDVSRSVADLTLKDDNFATIVYAIREGRTIFKNIRKFVAYQLSVNVAELLIIFVGVLLAPFLGWLVPLLLALQILFMNLVTDNFPAITLGLNPSSGDLMSEKPRKKARILTKDFALLLLGNGLFMALLTLISFYISFNILGYDIVYSRTVALATLISLEIASAFNFRSFRKGVFGRSLFVNPYLVYASLISLVATIIIIYTPARHIFETAPIGISGWLMPVLSFIVLWLVFDLWKLFNNRYHWLDFES
ncbi:MAG: cation-transporting P-type ATPase [Patescibacteria group bacterium]|nr:cation-transporting P-type ATPase [Patescibacteria group bacterium]